MDDNAGSDAPEEVLRIHSRHAPVTVLGPGQRAGIWVQGCTIGCAGCMSRDTWSAVGGRDVPVPSVLDWLRGLPGTITGVTISGGEPFQQVAGLHALLRGIRAWSVTRRDPVDVMVYSGYTTSALRRAEARAAAMDLCDVVVTGPFVARLAPGGSWRGSSNQRLEVLTELGRTRFGGAAGLLPGARLQAVADEAGLRVLGVPAPGDLDRLEDALVRLGALIGPVSWR